MLQSKPFHLCLADFGSAGVGTGVEFRLHFQSFSRGGVGDQVYDDFMADQRLTAPVLRDVSRTSDARSYSICWCREENGTRSDSIPSDRPSFASDTFHNRQRLLLLPPPSAVISNSLAWG